MKVNPIEKAEKMFAEYYGKKHAIMLCNGTATLHCCLLAAGVGPGDEVIVPALTMASPVLAVKYCGAKPVYADIDKKTLLINEKDVVNKINDKTKAIIGVSLYGHPLFNYSFSTNMNIFIEDNAQCLSARNYGMMSSFSFQQSKHITCGEGGMVLTDNDYYAQKVRTFGNLGYSWPIEKDDLCDPSFVRHTVVGYNYRPSEAQAEILIEEIPKIEERIIQRQVVAEMYRAAIVDSGILWSQEKSPYHSYWSFASILDECETWDWFVRKFRELGGDRVYAAWRVPYSEPALYDSSQRCLNAEALQPRILQFKTNYTDMDYAQKQADILKECCH